MKLKDFIFLQLAVLIYSLGSLFSKFAANQPFLSFKFILYMGLLFLSLVIYAIFWQQILKKTQLTIAFANKGTTVLWSILLGYLVFHESVSFHQILGALIVLSGIIVIAIGGKADE